MTVSNCEKVSSPVFSKMRHHEIRILIHFIWIFRGKPCFGCKRELCNTVVELFRSWRVRLFDLLGSCDFSWNWCTNWVVGACNRYRNVVLSLLVLAWSIVYQRNDIVILFLITLHSQFGGYSWWRCVLSLRFLRNWFADCRSCVWLRGKWSQMLRLFLHLVKKYFLLWILSLIWLRTYSVELRRIISGSMVRFSPLFPVMVDRPASAWKALTVLLCVVFITLNGFGSIINNFWVVSLPFFSDLSYSTLTIQTSRWWLILLIIRGSPLR